MNLASFSSFVRSSIAGTGVARAARAFGCALGAAVSLRAGAAGIERRKGQLGSFATGERIFPLDGAELYELSEPFGRAARLRRPLTERVWGFARGAGNGTARTKLRSQRPMSLRL